jgi:hypothetical protein
VQSTKRDRGGGISIEYLQCSKQGRAFSRSAPICDNRRLAKKRRNSSSFETLVEGKRYTEAAMAPQSTDIWSDHAISLENSRGVSVSAGDTHIKGNFPLWIKHQVSIAAADKKACTRP